MASSSTAYKAYIAPFVIFVLLLGAIPLADSLAQKLHFSTNIGAQHWIFPLQTIVCAILLAAFWRKYELHWPQRIFFTLGIAALIFLIWISPQIFFRAAPRREGFDPTLFEKNRALFLAVIAMRFARLVIVVPLVEEIFWRGFLLRYFIAEDFLRVPFGAYSRGSFAAVTLGFMFEHAMVDWPAAFCAGALFNLVAYRTKNLGSCVLAHAATNLLLGLFILRTRQWGFW